MIELSREAPVSCFDMTAAREATGRDLEGILGVPLFRGNIIQIDFDRQRLSISKGSNRPLPEWGQPVNVSYTKSSLPTVSVTLGNLLEERCIVDTGYNGSLSLTS